MAYVSVIIPAYNAADFISDAFRSLIGQSMANWEAIFVDDDSQDGTLDSIKLFAAADKRVKIISLSSNSGPAHARNAALEMAGGEWIAVLDADDSYSPKRLERLTGIGETTQADIVLDNQCVIDPISRRLAFLAFKPFEAEFASLNFLEFLRNVQSSSLFDFGYLKPIIRRRWLTTHDIRYQEQLRLGEDLMLLLECYAAGAKVILASKAYYYYTLQYSHLHRTQSPTTRSEAGCEALLAAAERFFEIHRAKQTDLERRLLTSACEYLRETLIMDTFRKYVKDFDVLGLCRCLLHPIRIVRGIYFATRRKVLLTRQARATIVDTLSLSKGHEG
jgi:succinoglycan biosynthesis protein ExoO